jgi:hypothetical protein
VCLFEALWTFPQPCCCQFHQSGNMEQPVATLVSPLAAARGLCSWAAVALAAAPVTAGRGWAYVLARSSSSISVQHCCVGASAAVCAALVVFKAPQVLCSMCSCHACCWVCGGVYNVRDTFRTAVQPLRLLAVLCCTFAPQTCAPMCMPFLDKSLCVICDCVSN